MEKVTNVIQSAIFDLFGVEQTLQLSRPDPSFGDYASNVAMQLAKPLGKNPREIAEMLSEKLRETGLFSEVTIAGPGFINLRINNLYLSNELKKIVLNPDEYGKSILYDNKVVVTEYSDPNPFKVLHVGHLYTSIIGDAISNIIESSGGIVHRVNFGGDVGLHVAKTMWATLKKMGGELPEKLFDIDENNRSEWMASRYIEGTRAYEDDDTAKIEIVALNKKIYGFHSENDHESALAQIYWTCRGWSYAYFDAFYQRIGTKFEKYYPESETADVGLKTVLEQKKLGVYRDSDGAVIFDGDAYGLHTRVFVNKEGIPTYESKDVGLSIKKWEDYRFDQSIIITGNDITEYMKVVLKSIEQFKPELAQRTRHLTHGNVKLAGGIKMSSRKGNFLRAVDVLDMTADENERMQGNRDEAPVLGAIKFTFLKNKIGADIVFDPKDSVSLQGNSGPYLQYALVRANSIIQKSEFRFEKSFAADTDFTDFERSLLFKMTEFPDIIDLVTNTLLPHHLCSYLYELAQEFNRFYEKSHVIGDDREKIRVCLVKAYSNILKKGLMMLGLPTPEKM